MLLRRFTGLSSGRTSSLSQYLSSLSITSLFPFSTLETPLNSVNDTPQFENHWPPKQHVQVDESNILNQLSDILSIPHSPSKIQKPLKEFETIRTAAVDEFLSPEDKLCGIFLQKLRGKSAVEQALSAVGIEISVDLFVKVLNKGNLGGDSMVTFFNWAMQQPNFPKDIVCHNLVVKVLSRRKYFKHMMEMLGGMKKRGICPNCDTLFIVMDGFIRARQVSKGIKMWDNLRHFGLKCNTEMFNVLLKCLTRRAYVGTACSLMNKMRGKIPFDSTTYNLVIGGCSRLGRVSEVERNLEAMVKDGITPDCSTYGYILKGMGRNGQIDGAFKVFRELESSGCVLNVEVYNAMIANYVYIGEMDKGLEFFEKLLDDDYEPNMDTFVRLIAGCLKARRVADAIDLFDQMLDRGIIPSTGTVTSFIGTLCGFGSPHAALMIYKKARRFGCRISLSSYKLLLMKLSKFGKCQMLLNVWDEMQRSGYSSDVQVYDYIINGFCNIGQVENAVLVMEESLRRGFCPSRLICSKLNNKLLSSKKVEVAYGLFLKLKVARENEKAKRHWRVKGWHF